MANEAVLLLETEQPVDRTCADNTGIEKGTILKLSDPNTVAASAADNDIFGGIAAEEKIANDGKTKISVYMGGEFVMTDSGSGVTAGDTLVVKGANLVGTGTTLDSEKGYKVGRALETATADQTLRVFVRAV